MDNTAKFNLLQKQIEKNESQGIPVMNLLKQQIDLLMDSHEEFIRSALASGYDLRNTMIGEIEVQQYSAMKQLAQKAGLPIQEYDDLIKQVKIRIFGKVNYKKLFNEQ